MDKKQEYNDIPVYFCGQCLSLRIKSIDDYDYCVDCGNTNIKIDHIDNWLEKYEYKYDEQFIKTNLK